MRMLAEWFPEFVAELDKMDELYKENRMIDEKLINLSALLFLSKHGLNHVF